MERQIKLLILVVTISTIPSKTMIFTTKSIIAAPLQLITFIQVRVAIQAAPAVLKPRRSAARRRHKPSGVLAEGGGVGRNVEGRVVAEEAAERVVVAVVGSED